MKNLFKPYFKTTDDLSKAMNTKSNGLGLSICSRIAQELSGKIFVTSELG
jgi:signal transduction histidine kinase